jgi:hypothetical protein
MKTRGDLPTSLLLASCSSLCEDTREVIAPDSSFAHQQNLNAEPTLRCSSSMKRGSDRHGISHRQGETMAESSECTVRLGGYS